MIEKLDGKTTDWLARFIGEQLKRPAVLMASAVADAFRATALEVSGDRITLSGLLIIAGPVAPENVYAAPPGSLYLRKSGGAATTLYVKESGYQKTGWIAK